MELSTVEASYFKRAVNKEAQRNVLAFIACRPVQYGGYLPVIRILLPVPARHNSYLWYGIRVSTRRKLFVRGSHEQDTYIQDNAIPSVLC
jgi:hypothetical protein